MRVTSVALTFEEVHSRGYIYQAESLSSAVDQHLGRGEEPPFDYELLSDQKYLRPNMLVYTTDDLLESGRVEVVVERAELESGTDPLYVPLYVGDVRKAPEAAQVAVRNALGNLRDSLPRGAVALRFYLLEE